ncbi:YybH family protein [Aeromicrobium alkaliterrae]|uniref:Nuclear transport factor 2 family protein n=1 Tax=Aeromicrobium alkaliterrae TaxID=302168 RepID=A0ABN2K4U6_9ACTN
MTTESLRDELRQFIADRVRAVGAGDASTLINAHDTQVLSFPVLPPARTRGTSAVAEALTAWVDSYSVGPGYEVHELEVDADSTLGYCAFRYHVTGTLTAGGEVDMWVRTTLVCRRVDATWKIVHQHESVPFDPETGQGIIDAAPESA